MKLCWDEIEKLRYNKKTGKWYKDHPNRKNNKWAMTPYLLNETGCLSCGEPFFYCLGNKGTCCSWSCSTKYRNSIYGISKETAIKIGKANTGKKRTPEEKALMKFRPQCQISGHLNPNWKNGITEWQDSLRNKSEYKTWKEKVHKRDNYICQNCGKNNNEIKGPLIAHHIKTILEHPELVYDINNGITLCMKCHKITHNKEHLFEKKYLQLIENMLLYNKNKI